METTAESSMGTSLAPVVTMSQAEWEAKGEELFGPDRKDWRFVCVQCGTVQTARDFLALGMEIKAIAPVLGFSCIGRFDKKQGCDWTLGGLLPIHRLQVVVKTGRIVPFFEFEEEKGSSSEAE